MIFVGFLSTCLLPRHHEQHHYSKVCVCVLAYQILTSAGQTLAAFGRNRANIDRNRSKFGQRWQCNFGRAPGPQRGQRGPSGVGKKGPGDLQAGISWTGEKEGNAALAAFARHALEMHVSGGVTLQRPGAAHAIVKLMCVAFGTQHWEVDCRCGRPGAGWGGILDGGAWVQQWWRNQSCSACSGPCFDLSRTAELQRRLRACRVLCVRKGARERKTKVCVCMCAHVFLCLRLHVFYVLI